MIERKMNGSPGRASSQELVDRVDRELALGKECLENIANYQRGNVADHTFIDDSPFQRDQEGEALASGRRLGKYVDPIRVIDVNSKRELRIPGEAFPEGLINPSVELSIRDDQSSNWGSSNTIGFIRVNGTEYPILSVDSMHPGTGMNDDVLLQIADEEYLEGSYREPVLDSFAQLRPGYKGGNVHNWMKDSNPCSKVNYNKVAKQRAKNKLARKQRR